MAARSAAGAALFPQYCAATSGAVFDQVSAVLSGWRRLPELHYIADYHDHPGYIEALRESVSAHWEARGRTAHLLMSFHGIPERNVRAGDPYFSHCHDSARLLADELLLRDGEWSVSFQSRFGPAGWLKPYTHTGLTALPARAVREVGVVCPGSGRLPRDPGRNRHREPAMGAAARAMNTSRHSMPARAMRARSPAHRTALPRLDACRAGHLPRAARGTSA
jgi:hypothetical protein